MKEPHEQAIEQELNKKNRNMGIKNMKVGVIGATGAVGRQIIHELENETNLTSDQIRLFASPRSEGSILSFRGKNKKVHSWTLENVLDLDAVIMSAGSSFSKAHSRDMTDRGITVIDNSSAFRMDPDVPLIVPEINGHALKKEKGLLIANPNCSTIQMVLSLQPLQKKFGIKKVMVSTYQSVSGAGQKGMDELSGQVLAHLKLESTTPKLFPQNIAFNTIPFIGAIDHELGYCEEEIKMIEETRKILQLPDLMVMPMTVRVPVFNCHGEHIIVELGREATIAEITKEFNSQKGLVFEPECSYAELPTPIQCTGSKEVYLARLCLMYGKEKSDWIQYWNISDNLLKGAATNAVQILGCLL